MRRNVVITEDELIDIRNVIDDWLYLYDYTPYSYATIVYDYDKVIALKSSLPLPDHEMEIAE